MVRAWFGNPHLRAGETRTSGPIHLPGVGVIVKVTATDAAGHRLTAWSGPAAPPSSR